MKIIAFAVRDDEKEAITDIARKLGVEVVQSKELATLETAELVKGCEGVSTLGQTQIDAALLDKYKEYGVKYLSTRSIGYNHIDINHAKAIGIKVCNAAYSPNGVADFAVMLMLMCLRNYKQALWRRQAEDLSLDGLEGREIKDLTVGVMGTGRIGVQVMKNLSGFGCRLLAYDVYENEEAKKLGEYVQLDTLLRESDIITMHMPMLNSTYHIINKGNIDKMKKGVVIINCARGELASSEALIEGVESGKIGALGLDTVEGEEGIIHVDHRLGMIHNRDYVYLQQFRNVIMTPHMAFYTDDAVVSMVRCGIKGIHDMATKGSYRTEIV